jgi:hypothetical protein
VRELALLISQAGRGNNAQPRPISPRRARLRPHLVCDETIQM